MNDLDALRLGLVLVEITLADVLIAVGSQKKNPLAVDDQGFLYVWKTNDGFRALDVRLIWNLAEPYDGQTQEVKDFIGTLIGVTD